MASFVKNIEKIRGTAIHGPEMREAIAQAIQQAMNLDLSGTDFAMVNVSPISGATGEYMLTMTNTQGGVVPNA